MKDRGYEDWREWPPYLSQAEALAEAPAVWLAVDGGFRLAPTRRPSYSRDLLAPATGYTLRTGLRGAPGRRLLAGQLESVLIGGVGWSLARDGWVGPSHLGDAVLTGDAFRLFPFSVGQSDYGALVEVVGIPTKGYSELMDPVLMCRR